MKRHRHLAAAVAAATVLLTSGCLGMGGDDSAQAPPPAATAPVSAAPVAVAAATLGGPVRAASGTPKDVAAALKGDDVIVVAFLVRNAADDQSVAAAVDTVRADSRSRRGARFFVYTVGTDRFGDLADLLGVTGTPSVAVIGRDRSLTNLFTGLVDAEILRQSISDAADTAAANAGGAQIAAASGALGDPAGIALAKKVRAAYTDVPAVAIAGELSVQGEVAVTMDAKMALDHGDITSYSGTMDIGGASFELSGSPTSFHLRSSGASCWAALPVGTVVSEAVSNPAIPLDGTRFSAPRRSGGDLVLESSQQGGPAVTWVIDAATHRVKELRAGPAGGSITFRAIDTAPAAVAPSPVCSDPREAIDEKALSALGA